MNENNNQFFNTPQNSYFPQDQSIPNGAINPNQQQVQNYNYINQNMVPNQNFQQPQQVYNQVPMENQVVEQQYAPLTPTNQTIPNTEVEKIDTLGQVAGQVSNDQQQNTFVAATVVENPANKAAPVEVVEQQPVALDPLNNANNPVPVNPVASPDTRRKVVAVGVSPFTPLKAFLTLLKKPGELIEETVPKYEHLMSSMMFTGFLTITTLVLTLLARLVVGGFIKSYNNASGSYTSTFDPSNIMNQDFLHFLLIAFIVSGLTIVAVTIICYASSFLNSKGLTLGKILMITNVSFMPFILGINVVSQLLSIISDNVGFASLVISIIYTIILFTTGMNHYIQTDKLNTKILYNLINFSIVIIIVTLILSLLYPGLSVLGVIGVAL